MLALERVLSRHSCPSVSHTAHSRLRWDHRGRLTLHLGSSARDRAEAGVAVLRVGASTNASCLGIKRDELEGVTQARQGCVRVMRWTLTQSSRPSETADKTPFRQSGLTHYREIRRGEPCHRRDVCSRPAPDGQLSGCRSRAPGSEGCSGLEDPGSALCRTRRRAWDRRGVTGWEAQTTPDPLDSRGQSCTTWCSTHFSPLCPVLFLSPLTVCRCWVCWTDAGLSLEDVCDLYVTSAGIARGDANTMDRSRSSTASLTGDTDKKGDWGDSQGALVGKISSAKECPNRPPGRGRVSRTD